MGTGTVKTIISRAWEDELVGRGVFRSLKKRQKDRARVYRKGAWAEARAASSPDLLKITSLLL